MQERRNLNSLKVARTLLTLVTSILLIMFVVIACKKDKKDDNPEKYDGSTVYVIDGGTVTSQLESIGVDGTLTFSSLPSNQTPKANDIICSAPAGHAPRGFLYRVKNITKKDGKIVIQTKEVSLEEAIEKADVKETINLDDYIIGVFDEDGNLLNQKSTSKETTKFDIKLTSHGIGIEGSVEISNKLEFEMNIDGWNLQYMKFAYTGETELIIKIIGEKEGKIQLWKDVKIATIKLAPITIMIGVIPVVITPEIPIYLNGELNGKLKASFTLFDIKNSLTIGAKYENKNVIGIFETNSSSSKSLLERLKAEVSGELKTTVAPGVEITFYNYPGLSFAGSLGLYGKAKITLLGSNVAQILEDLNNNSRYNINPELKILAGAEASVKAKLEIISIKFVDYKNTMKIYETELLHGSVFPQFTDISFTNITPHSATATATVITPTSFNFMFPISQHGILLSKNSLPTVSNSVYHNTLGPLPATWTPLNVPVVSANLTNLELGQPYYVCTYYTNIFGTFYGKVKNLNENDDPVTFTINDATNITQNSATFNASVTSNTSVTDKGICYSNQNNTPTTNDSKISKGNGTGNFSVTLTNLQESTCYYARPYAIANGTTYYGEVKTFVTTHGGSNDGYVLINGVKWATRNVNMPGTFAAKPEDAGMFYQWNRKIGWSSTDPMVNSNGGTTWNSTASTGTTWEPANDPSPSSYRVPTKEEIQSLLDENHVTNVWTTENGVTGIQFTDKNNGNSIFLPAAGHRELGYGMLTDVGWGSYWSSAQEDEIFAYFLGFSPASLFFTGKGKGFPVRPVAE